MSARFTTGQAPAKHNQRMKTSEIDRAIVTERQLHHLAYRKGSSMALCNCGYLLRDVTSRDVHARHAMHVAEVMRVFEARLNGEEP